MKEIKNSLDRGVINTLNRYYEKSIDYKTTDEEAKMIRLRNKKAVSRQRRDARSKAEAEERAKNPLWWNKDWSASMTENFIHQFGFDPGFEPGDTKEQQAYYHNLVEAMEAAKTEWDQNHYKSNWYIIARPLGNIYGNGRKNVEACMDKFFAFYGLEKPEGRKKRK